MTTQSDMHFAFASDEKFTLQLQAAVCSLLKSSVGLSSRQVVHVLDCGISEDSWQCVEATIEAFASRFCVLAKIERHVVEMAQFEGFRIWNSSKATYARLLLAKLLPSVRYCVYADCDILFFKNPWDLVAQLTHAGVAVLGHKNPVSREGRNIDEQWFIDHQEPYSEDRYFCAGLIAMDLDRFRVPGAIESMLDFLSRHPDVVSADQTALNWYFRNDCALAEDGWGVFPNECFGDKYKIFAIHFSGGVPWKGLSSWYEYIMQKRQSSIWRDFVKKFLGQQIHGDYMPFSVRFSGAFAYWLTRVLLPIRALLPFKKYYFAEAYDVMFGHRELDCASKRLLS